MNVNYDRVCRLCLSSRGELLPIFPTTSSDDTEPPVLVTKIKDCVSVQINENDELPTNVCRKCMDNVNNWHIFKTVCVKTQNKLQSLIKKDGSLLEEVKIKSEPNYDEAYDDGVVIDGSYPVIENVASTSKLQPEGPPILASLGLTPRSDKNVDPRMDWHRVHAILDMVQENNIIDSLQSTEETDILHLSDHDSETEGELQPDLDDAYIRCDKGYKCRDRSIISKNPHTETNSTKQTNKVRKRKAVAVKHCPRPKNAWQLLFTDDLLELIVTSTNENIVANGKSNSTVTTADEIKTLIGVLYLHGIMRPTCQDYSDLWDSYCGMSCVKKAMSLERFRFLLQNLRFDTQNDALTLFDIMKRMRKAFEIFAMNCRTAFEIETVAVVDEIIVPVYGPCPFRYDIDKKPLKRGIKMVLLIDPTNFYISNLDVITDPYFGADEIVKKITQHLFESGRSIVMDSWYFSRPLMDALKSYNLYTVAALNPQSEKIPPLFMSQYRKTRTFMSGFFNDEVSLTSFVDSQSKSLNVITNEPKFYRRGPNINHVTAVSVYKKNQSAVEVVDVLMHYYTTMQHTNDWTLSLFFTLLNIASVNAQVIWSSRNSNVTKRRLFIKDLALGLLENEEFSLLLPEDKLRKPLPPLLSKPSYRNRKRCKICVQTTKRDRRTREYCLKCGQFICREHSVPVCTMCTNN